MMMMRLFELTLLLLLLCVCTNAGSAETDITSRLIIGGIADAAATPAAAAAASGGRDSDERIVTLRLFANATARNATCNDGTPSGYYMQQSASLSTRWIIYLEGGGLCYDVASCLERAHRTPILTSSTPWPKHLGTTGLLGNQTSNEFADFNVVVVIYCTSDLYSGNTHARTLGWDFHGSYIVPALLDDLSTHLNTATEVLFTGGSAGGIGTFMNWPTVHARLSHVAKVRALPDAGWFLDVPPYSSKAVPVERMLKEGMVLYNGVVPAGCADALGDKAYMCYSGPIVYPYMPGDHAHMFVQKAQTDAWTLGHDGISLPFDSKEIEWMTTLAAEVRATLSTDKTVAFSANCIYHTSVQRLYDAVAVNGVTLHEAIVRWYFQGSNASYVDTCESPLCNATC